MTSSAARRLIEQLLQCDGGSKSEAENTHSLIFFRGECMLFARKDGRNMRKYGIFLTLATSHSAGAKSTSKTRRKRMSSQA